MKKVVMFILVLLVLSSCASVKRETEVWGYTLKEYNILMDHSIYKDWKPLFEHVDLIYNVYDNWNYILCNWVKFMKDWINVNNKVIKNEDKIMDTIGWEPPYDKEIADECIVYNEKKEIDKIKDVLLHSYNIKEDREEMKKFVDLVKKYR